jgi:RNA ligase (TIGR02306 family)
LLLGEVQASLYENTDLYFCSPSYNTVILDKHPNADTLDLVQVGGWQCVSKTGQFHIGSKVAYIEPNSVLTKEFSDKIGVTQYLKTKTNKDGEKVLVVGQTKLRGEPSFGILLPADNKNVGDDLSSEYGIIKFEPPVKQFNGWGGLRSGNTEAENPFILPYTDINNLRKYPNIFDEGEEVIATVKVHGTNSRFGFVVDKNSDLVFKAGSRRMMRRNPHEKPKISFWKRLKVLFRLEKPPKPYVYEDDLYWHPYKLEGIRNLMFNLHQNGVDTATLYGELFGGNIQIFDYGRQTVDYVAFDLMIDGKFLSFDEFVTYMTEFNIPYAPVVYRGKYDIREIVKAAELKNELGGNHISEGVVVRPVEERTHPKIGRLIAKYINDAYLLNKAVEQADTTDI